MISNVWLLNLVLPQIQHLLHHPEGEAGPRSELASLHESLSSSRGGRSYAHQYWVQGCQRGYVWLQDDIGGNHHGKYGGSLMSQYHLKVDGGDEPQEGAAERRRIHGNSAEFQHLEQHDMDQLCARVVLTGVKPQ